MSTEYQPENNDKTQHSIVVLLAGAKTEQVIQIRYIVSGLTFAPSYKMILNESKGILQIQGHATVLNDALNTDLICSLNLLAGVPNILMDKVHDPMSNERQSVADFLRDLSRSGQNSNGGGGMQMQSRMMSNMMTQQAMPGAGGGEPGNVEDNNSQDLHVYSFKNVKCRQRQRVVLDLFPSMEGIKYSDIHEADEVSLSANANKRGNSADSPIDVYHSIAFNNETTAPFTTGPVLVTTGADQQLVCQTMTNFTPVGAETKVKLTKTLGLRVMHEKGS